MKATSVHVQPVKESSERHNRREKELKYVNKKLSNLNENWELCTQKERLEEIKKLVKAKTGRQMQAKATPLREAVIVIDEHTTMKDLQTLADRYRKEFGIDCFQISIHRDEGHTKDGKWIPNLHAHMVFDWVNHETGKSIKLMQGKHVNRKTGDEFVRDDMSRMQDIAAEVLHMERGVTSDRQHLSALQYKNAAQEQRLAELQQDVKKEKTKARTAEKKAKEAKMTAEGAKVELEKAISEKAELESQTKREKKRLSKVKEDAKSMEEQLSDLQKKKESAEKDTDQAKKDLEKTQKSVTDAQKELEGITPMLNKKKALETQLKTLQEKINKIETIQLLNIPKAMEDKIKSVISSVEQFKPMLAPALKAMIQFVKGRDETPTAAQCDAVNDYLEKTYCNTGMTPFDTIERRKIGVQNIPIAAITVCTNSELAKMDKGLKQIAKDGPKLHDDYIKSISVRKKPDQSWVTDVTLKDGRQLKDIKLDKDEVSQILKSHQDSKYVRNSSGLHAAHRVYGPQMENAPIIERSQRRQGIEY